MQAASGSVAATWSTPFLSGVAGGGAAGVASSYCLGITQTQGSRRPLGIRAQQTSQGRHSLTLRPDGSRGVESTDDDDGDDVTVTTG
ncbi:hypothetical protein CLOP_g11184 [Closterium sp. NIES-67]|nr:hypothetical protein CLOP_g11184 [Closterium sp. NIES-67]